MSYTTALKRLSKDRFNSLLEMPRQAAPRLQVQTQLGFNSLLEMPIAIREPKTAKEEPSFNSLLEMRLSYLLDEVDHSIDGFNSLLEMHAVEGLDKRVVKSLVSILYWRCLRHLRVRTRRR